MGRLKVFKVITSITIIFAVLCLNVSVNFSVLLKKDAQSGHFIQVGAIEAWADTDWIVIYSNPNSGTTVNDSASYLRSLSAGSLTISWNASSRSIKISSSGLYSRAGQSNGGGGPRDNYAICTVTLTTNAGDIVVSSSALMTTDTGYSCVTAYPGVSDVRGNPPTTVLPDNITSISKITVMQYAYINFEGDIHSTGMKYAYYPTSILLNAGPTISVTSPSPNITFSEADTAFIPQVSVSDVDNDTLTCKYYIDAETTPRDTKTATNTTTVQTVSFSALNMSTLTEGNHSIKYEVSDGKAPLVTSTVSFKVDKSAPTLSTVSVTSAISSITLSGSASDSIAGLDNYPYQYTIGSNPPTSWITNTTYTQDNLIPNTQYPVIFQARDTKNHIASNTQYIYTKAAVPALVVNNASSYTLDVSTTDSNSASTQYLISVNGGTQYVTPEGTLTSSPVWITLSNKKITVTGLTPSTAYSFQAKARNGANIETAISSVASGTTLIAPPVAPVNLIATATSSQVTVSWDSVQGAAGYDIQADGTIINAGTSTAYTHTSLSPGTPHTYKVRAKNAGGTGDWSTQITKSTLPSSPDIPANLSTVSQSTSITVTWNNVAGATGYDIEVDGVLVNNGPNTNYVHSSLTPGTHHSYRVRSINPGGKSDWSAPVSATTTQVSSPVPANLAATPSQNEISLTWDTVDGASGYDIEVDGISIDNNTNTSYTHTNLAPGSQHMYRVRSKKSGVLSDWSSTVISTALTDVFGTPSNLKANVDDTSVALSWSAVTGAAGYDVEADGVAIDNGTSTTAIISGLQPNSSHTYRVRARSGSETSEWSQAVQVMTYALPTPVILNSASSETTVSIVWDSTTSAALTYELEADGTVIQGIQGNTYTCSGLLPNTQHIFRVRSINASGTSNWSIPLTKSTMFSGVTVPTGLFAMMKSTSATIAWQPMNGATSYDIDVDGTIAENIAETKYIHTGLQPGSQHTYRVRARNETGSSDWSAAITVLTIPEGPAVPSNITASSTISKILVSWDQVSGADEYEIEVDGVIVANGTGTSYLQSSLTPDTQHNYRVRAKSPAGYSAWSDLISANTKSSTMTYTVDCLTGEELNLVFSAANIQDIGQYTFTITYDPDELEAVDLCGSTSKIDLAAGNITGTDVQIVQFAPGTIVFKKTGSAQSYEIWSGIVNTVRFKSKFDGQADVTYSFQ
ncbi:MAG: galactose oxidase [Clostridiaceae bacterium]